MHRVLARVLYVLAILRARAEDERTFREIESFECRAATVGFGEDKQRKDPGESLVACGAALIGQALSSDILTKIMTAFSQLPEDTLRNLRHGAVREKRLQTHLPFEPPFSSLELLGANGVFAGPLEAALGSDFVVDLVTIVEVPAGAEFQDPHRDTALEGSISAHIPLHALEEDMAPLGFCAGTHVLSGEETKRVLKESMLYRRPGENSQVAKRRLYCGGHHRTDVMQLTVSPGVAAALRVRDSRLGVSIANLRNKKTQGIAWKVGDELTHANGKRINHSEDWDEFVASAAADKIALDLTLERPSPEEPPKEPPLMVVGAPLSVGDVLLYDSRIFHWGMKNSGSNRRYVLYASFKKSAEHEGVHPEAHVDTSLARARDSFGERLKELRQTFAGRGEL